jgi:hypothetical protein
MATIILIRQYFPGNPIIGLLYHFALGNPLIISNVYLYCLNNPVSFIDPLGTDVWFIGIGLAAFISESPTPLGKRGYAVQSSMGLALDTKGMKFRFYKTTAIADRYMDIVRGAGIGMGPSLGLLRGDMEDFLGMAKERTSYWAIISTTEIETECGRTGFAISAGGKGWGWGYTSIETGTLSLF